MNYETLEASIAKWAAAEPHVQALVVIGSRARIDHPADSWSDLDLILVVSDPQAYVNDTSWLDTFGKIWLRVLNFTGAGDPEWMVLYAGGFKVDLILASLTGRLADMLSDSHYAKATQRGQRILIDKKGDDMPAAVSMTADPTWVQPAREAFSVLLHHFWLSAYRAGSMINRGELWRARTITDGPLRQQLLQMLEWHARARNGIAHDTWYQGRFLTDWVDERVLAELPKIFAPFNNDATRHAIMASLSLMDSLGRETAEIWGYPYPILNQSQIQDWIEVSLAVDQVDL